MNLRIEDVMVRKVVTIDSRSSVKQATITMGKYCISSLVVLSGKKLDGILTTRDIVTRVVAKGLDPDKVKVREAMSRPVIMMNPEAPLEEAVKTMLKYRIKKLPLVCGNKNNSKLVGILSISDIAELHPRIYATFKEMINMNTPAKKLEGIFYVT